MKPYRITIRPAHAPAWHFTGLYASGFDAVNHAVELTWGQHARIHAQVLA